MMPEIRLAVIHCTVCDQNKPIDDFYPSGRASKTGQCKSCIKKRMQDRETERVKAGLPRRKSKKKAKNPRPSSPPSVSAESLMATLAGGGAADPLLEAVLQIVAMQQKTVELLLERRGK